MLISLQIVNYALIKSLQINWKTGFSVITGETGAGKSIMLGAINLLLGQRADVKSIKKGATRCIIEAEFLIKNYGLESWFKTNDFPFDNGQCILRRELQITGKSRAFINDTPAQLFQMKELGQQLIDVHSQHQNLLLSKEDFQLHVIDLVAHNQELLHNYQEIYATWRIAKKQLEEEKKHRDEQLKELDYKSFLLDEFEKSNLRPEEQLQLETTIETATHAQEIIYAMGKTNSILTDEGNGVIDLLRNAKRELSAIQTHFSQAEDLCNRINSTYIELKDIADESANTVEGMEHDPNQLQEMQNRLDLIYRLQQKHHVSSMQELLDVWNKLSDEVNAIENVDVQINKLQEKVNLLYKQASQKAKELTSIRKETVKRIEKSMIEQLKPLGMPHVNFFVDLKAKKEMGTTGNDIAHYLFSANKNGELKQVSQIASGGEIARVMLCLKSMIAKEVKLPTIIFDEIDTGVSGEIATKMAVIMRQMGTCNRQVVSITHLPQIAAMGSVHYKVYKEDTEDATNSQIKCLSDNERIEEIAYMVSGSSVTESALENAKTLLKNAQTI